MRIETLPIQGEQRERLLNAATEAFMTAARRAGCVRKVKSKWDPDAYLDEFADEHQFPMDEEYLIYLIDAFMIHHVLDLLGVTKKSDP